MSVVHFVRLIESLGCLSSTNAKIAEIKANIDKPNVVKLFNLALSPFVTMGIKQFDSPTAYGQEDDIGPFLALTTALQARDLTGGDARARITETLAMYDRTSANVLTQVLRQKFECKVGSSLINKAAGRPAVDEYDVMLADKFSPKFKWKAGKVGAEPYFVEWKYDGMRVIGEWLPDGNITYRSREGIVQENVPAHITEQLRIAAARLIAAFPGEDWENGIEFDGEIMADTYSDTMKIMKKARSPEETKTLRFYLFDLVPRSNWIARSYDRKFLSRRERVVAAAHGETVKTSYGVPCADKEAVMAEYARLVEAGAEGAMIKTTDHVYEWRRAKSWTKFKPVFTADLECYELYDGDPLSAFAGTFGGGRLRGYLEDGTYVECDCGSGFKLIRQNDDSEPTRDEIYANPSLALNMIWEVEYQEVTQASTKDVKSLRFVVFKRIRHDKSASRK